MQRIYTSLLVIIVSIITACKKDGNNNTTDPNNVPGLPPATQSGANTFGCLVNGVPWVPEGYGGGSPNLSIDYDPGFNNGIFGIAAYRKTANENSSIGIGIADSLNFIKAPIQLILGKKSLYGVFYSNENCFITYFDTSVYRKGFLKINTYDKTKKIIAGTFEAILFKSGCIDTIRITKGRFDFKF
jgi:hypothetical protein